MQLRAFLKLRAPSGEWAVTVGRDLDAIMSSWRDRDSPATTGILHLGFDRPSSKSFEDVAGHYPGRMLLTGAARFGLPHGYDAYEYAVGEVEGLPIHLAMRGFGYELKDEDLPSPPVKPADETHNHPRDWVAGFVAQSSEHASSAASAGIFDDASYLALEQTLARPIRHELGEFRFRHLVGEDDSDPAKLARCAPPWLSTMPVSALPLTVRITNVFERQNIETVGDIARFEPQRLFKLAGFGRTSFHELRKIILEALAKGPTSDEDEIEAAGAITLLEGIHTTLKGLGDRERDILVRRMGLAAPAETLAEIGDSYGVTRERIRQVEAKLIKRIIREDKWDDLLTRKLSALLSHRERPLPVIGVEALDPWFKGIAVTGDALSYILENMCGDNFHVLEIDSVPYFARIDQEAWDASQREARALLKASVGAGWTEAHCRSFITSLLDPGAREFSDLLWDAFSAQCHFTAHGNTRTLTGFGRSVEALVEAVLREAPRPLHYREIADTLATRSIRDVDERRVRNAAQTVAYLYGRGRYGLETHCTVSEEIRATCREEVECIISEGPQDRQWHCDELVWKLAEQGLEDEGLDKYALDMILRTAPSLERLGRLMWAAKRDGARTSRTDIRKAIAAILREAGGPLDKAEIMKRLTAVRGTQQSYILWSFDPVLNLGRGLWGLNDRDISVSRETQAMFFERVSEILASNGVGLHVSEIYERYPDLRRFGIDVDLLGSLASHSQIVKISIERYLYLPAWGDARRERLVDAVTIALRDHARPMPFEAVARVVENRLRRPLDRGKLSTLLQRVGTYDAAAEGWSLGDDEDEEDSAAL